MTDFEEPDLIPATVICHTPGCENEGIPIQVLYVEVVLCGPCGQQITDINPVRETESGRIT